MEWFNELLDAMVTGAVGNGWVLQHSSVGLLLCWIKSSSRTALGVHVQQKIVA